MFLFKTQIVSDTELCLSLQVEPTQLDPMDRASPYLRSWDGDRIQYSKRRVF
jgi:hypothetical protein